MFYNQSVLHTFGDRPCFALFRLHNITLITKKVFCVSGKEEAAEATLDTNDKNTKEAETLGNENTLR